MNKIKTIKIKEEDGSISEESYTIAADAINIDMKNGKDLQETVGNIDIDIDGNIATQLKNKINKNSIVDNLDSTDSNKVLSANQGKILGDKLNKKPYYYNTVADMKADTKLKVGDMAITLGYYEANDGLIDKYIIKESSSNEYILLNNNFVAEKINIKSLSPNKNFNLKMGMTSFLRNASKESIENQINNVCKNYFSCLKQQVRFIFNESTLKFDLIEASNIEDQINAINTYINNGGEFKGLHFYVASGTLLTLFQTYTDSFIMEKYLEAIINFINLLPYKNIINRLWILNEVGQDILSDTYAASIISTINSLQAMGYQISIPMAYVEQYGEVSKNILNELDFYSQNLYPTHDVYGEFSSIDDMKERFDMEYRLLEPFIQNKELVISEFGCSASWYSFAHPSDYQDDHNGKPISIFIEGFFRSHFASRVSQCYFWYYMDAYRYAPETLISIKNNTEVHYG